ncbi:hypothetical protein Gpo141_00010948 [Globisporangium polare]
MRGAQIAPVPFEVDSAHQHPQERHPRAALRFHQAISSAWERWAKFWHAIQISHRGKYSIERLQALDEYCQTTSLFRALLVCILTPVPTLVIVGMVELLPLRPISEGWRANYSMWIRLTIMTAIVTLCIVLQTRSLMKELPLTIPAAVGITICTSLAYTSSLMLLANYWVYPIPFTIGVGLVPYCVFVGLFYVLFVGLKAFRETPGLATLFARYGLFISVQGSLVIIYPAYNAVFQATPDHSRPALVLALPVLKVALKNAIARLIDNHEDYLPETAVFTVELFNAIYLVTCMQQGGTTATALVVIGLDLVSSTLSLRSVHKNSNHMKMYFVTGAGSKTFLDSSKRNCLTSLTLDLLHDPEHTINVEEIKDIRGRSSNSHSVSSRGLAILSAFENIRRSQPLSPAPPTISTIAEQSTAEGLLPSDQQNKAMAVRQTLQMLFYWEYIVLVEYIECVLPLMYVTYMSAVIHSPNAEYHLDTKGLVQNGFTGTVYNVILYSALEFLSFMLLNVLLARKFSFSSLFQLAFVLENQMTLLQAKMLTFLLFTFQFTLDHFGADFTFQFLWLKVAAAPPPPPK